MGKVFEWIWRFLIDLFVNKKINGELTVTGSDQAIYELPERPDFVEVSFADECTVPCDPGCDDTVLWDVKHVCCDHECERKCKCCRKHKKWVLVISWKVSGVRKIVWEVIS